MTPVVFPLLSIQHKMKLFLIFALIFVISAVTEIHCDKELAFKYNGMDMQTTLPAYFDIAMEGIKLKEGSDTIFLINGDVEQKLILDDEWKVEMKIFRSDIADGEYTEYLSLPEFGTCTLMKTLYKKYFYPLMKECSNLPTPETCPLEKAKYHASCEFDANVFRDFAKPGFYRFYADLYHNGNHETGIVVRGSVHEK